MADGQARYSPMCNDRGGTVDDLIVYRERENRYLIVVNAANREKDYRWMKDHALGDTVFTDVSDDYAQIALQGPKAIDILAKIAGEESIPKKYYHGVFGAEAAGIPNTRSSVYGRTGR